MNETAKIEAKRVTAQLDDLIARGHAPAPKRMHLIEMQWQALFLMEKYGLRPGEWDGWSLKWDRRTHQAGYCNWDKQEISFSASVFAASSEDQCLDTILHEIAHALEPGHRGNIHTAAWRTQFILMGGSGEVTYDESDLLEPPAGARWEGVCPQGHTIYRVCAPRRGQTYQCRRDRETFLWYEL
jgi:predicted SprT family Zn-dependent metalloprotease